MSIKKIWESDWTLLIPETHKENGNMFWMILVAISFRILSSLLVLNIHSLNFRLSWGQKFQQKGNDDHLHSSSSSISIFDSLFLCLSAFFCIFIIFFFYSLLAFLSVKGLSVVVVEAGWCGWYLMAFLTRRLCYEICTFSFWNSLSFCWCRSIDFPLPTTIYILWAKCQKLQLFEKKKRKMFWKRSK